MTAQTDTITVEVAYALPDDAAILRLEVPVGTTVRQAAEQSGIVKRFPQIDLDTAPFGIFGQAVKNGDHVLTDGDRVEIYRPLLIDPKEARRQRARDEQIDKPARASKAATSAKAEKAEKAARAGNAGNAGNDESGEQAVGDPSDD